MKERIIVIVTILIILIAFNVLIDNNNKIISTTGAFSLLSLLGEKHISDKELSGKIIGNQVWSGDILITGDVVLYGDLKILPGTVIRFAIGDKEEEGYETVADGYNDIDPTRTIEYSKTHSSLTINGKLTAIGTEKNKIIFTSAAKEPKIADWEAVYVYGDGSIIENAILEYSRNGITTGDLPTPNSVFKKNIIRYTMWGGLSFGWSGAQAYENEIYECGHEGIDIQGRDVIAIGNFVHDCHTGIVVLRGSSVVKDNILKNVGNGIHAGKGATPTLENNIVELAPLDSEKEWRYGDFAYKMFGEPDGTPLLTEIYSLNGIPRYSVPGYRLDGNGYVIELPFEYNGLVVYGWKDEGWKLTELAKVENGYKIEEGYYLYTIIPEPTKDERDVRKFNRKYSDIYKIMALAVLDIGILSE